MAEATNLFEFKVSHLSGWELQDLAQDTLKDILDLLKYEGNEKDGCKFFTDPDETFVIVSSPKWLQVLLLEGESKGDCAFLAARTDGYFGDGWEIQRFEYAPWVTRVKLLQ